VDMSLGVGGSSAGSEEVDVKLKLLW